jgi:putative component of toxin-antitoxin plasmid stabilization module
MGERVKYPLDQATYNEFITHLIAHSNMQVVLIERLSQLLTHAMDASEHDDDEWFKDAEILFKELRNIKGEHDTRRWNEANYQRQMNAGAYKAPPQPVASDTKALQVIAKEGLQHGKVERIERDDGHIVGLPGLQFDDRLNMVANKEEAKFGPEMSEEELERMFSQKRPKIKKVQEKKLSQMTMEEINDWEAKQNDATDIYKIAARVKNLARGNNASLTQQGEILCNSYVHVMKALYDFADKLEDKNVKAQLTNLIRNQEGMPGTIIAAAGAGVNIKK